MDNNYSQNELNEILLSKKLNEFYLAIIENRKEELTDEEYNEIINQGMDIFGDNKNEVKDLINEIETNEQLKEQGSELLKLMFGLGQIRQLAVLTMIDDNIYDIANTKFINIKRNKIINYDNLANYYNENSARPKLFTPEEVPGLNNSCVLIDIDDDTPIKTYEQQNLHQDASDDLTSSFIDEVKGKTYTLKK